MIRGDRHPDEELSAYADDELSAEETEAVEEHLETCTECRRELAVIRTMGEAMNAPETTGDASVWGSVRRRIVEPSGWLLVGVGAAALAGLSVVHWFRAGTPTVEWLATTALLVGLGLVAVSIGWEQYREWKDSPYKDVRK